MFKATGKNRLMVLAASVCIAMMGVPAFSKADPTAVEEEPGYYYGRGKGSTKEEAQLAGKRNLIERALTLTVKASNPKASYVNVSDESVASRLVKVDPYRHDKPGTTVVYRVKSQDWEKDEKAFQDSLRQTLAPKYESFIGKKNVADKLNAGVEILNILASNGETDLLTVQAGGTELFTSKVEAVCASAVKNLRLTLSVKDGIVGESTKFSVEASDSNGGPVSGLNLKAVWEIPALLGEAETPSDVISIIKTDSLGKAYIDYPVAGEFKEKPVTLTVSTVFADNPVATKTMKKFDADSAVDGRYVYIEDINSEFATARVEAGEFMAGAVPQDRNARRIEASRPAETGAYEISVAPVTNIQFAAYLHAVRSESRPEYLDNSDFNQPDQPVIGVSVADAEGYAAWLSQQTGAKYRLPTEEEWEKAARAGKEIIYPWGDDAPNVGKNANYKGNGKYKFTSPVGAFENGKNDLGLVDMSGNVWEWTSSTHSAEEGSSLRTVKGGSWMDGPTDLRISNFKDEDGTAGYADVGFRLVKEVSE